MFTYLPKYLGPATKRMNQFAPSGFTFNYNDTYAMQSICAYEYNYIGMSDFCLLFTADEWAGFENTLEMECQYALPSPLPSSNFEQTTMTTHLAIQPAAPKESVISKS